MQTATGSRASLYCAGGGIGDSLVAPLVARALHARFARVDALTLAAHRAVLERVPDVDAVLVDDRGDERALAEMLRERKYATCVVTWATPRTARVPRLRRFRCGSDKRGAYTRFDSPIASWCVAKTAT